MINPEINEDFQLAADFVLHTSRNIFVTGKAGTGKTTFLQYIKEKTQKNTVVVAPTGVAAINAGGITMHSFFQLPFLPFVPERTGFGDSGNSYVDVHTLFQTVRFNKAKINLYQELELLIIDEVSMLRCDYLDCIDAILRHHRRMLHLPFGGVQVVFIGDMFQLPPVVREWDILSNYYESPFFFSARVLKEQAPVYIELRKIYRQREAAFIDLLNKIRNNAIEQPDLNKMHTLYQPWYDYKHTNDIVLTTHNNKATEINQDALQRLEGEIFQLKGETWGDFEEREYPVDMTLTLKIGAQVMFIRNDSSPEKRYFNGKIATVTAIDKDKQITVLCKGETVEFKVEKEEWKKVRFVLDNESEKIDEDVVGTFTHYPLRLAWAITIHKSQGLTFDKVVIDAGESFAAGQVYVALSRCTNINGVILLSRINKTAISTDERIIRFQNIQADNSSLSSLLKEEMRLYQNIILMKIFDWTKMLRTTDDLMDLLAEKSIQNKDQAIILIRDLDVKNKTLYDTGQKFVPKIHYALMKQDAAMLADLVQRAIPYYCQFILDNLIKPLQNHIEEVGKQKKVKAYLNFLRQTEMKWRKKIEQIEQLTYNQSLFYTGKSFLAKTQVKEIPIQVPAHKGDSNKESFDMYKSGKTIAEIAAIRNLTTGTIEGHLAKYVQTGELDIHLFVTEDKMKQIALAIKELGDEQVSPIKTKLGDDYSYHEIRMVVNHLRKEEIGDRR